MRPANDEMRMHRELKPRIAIDGKRNSLYIGADVIRFLGMPSHICMRVSEDRTAIAIMACDEKDVFSFKVPDRFLVDHKCLFRICSKAFVNQILEVNGLDPECRYSLLGTSYEKGHALIFSIDNEVDMVSNGV